MLSAEAVRLLAIEALCPTEALAAKTGFPTLAGARVFDSRAPSVSDIDNEADYTPVLSLYTPESGVALRGPLTDYGDTEADAVLDVVAELAIVTESDGETIADAMADGDPAARLVLAALASQVRAVLEFSTRGKAFRKLVRQVMRIEQKTYAVPQYGLRWHRMTLRYHMSIRDDVFDMAAGGLPEPVASVAAALPEDSYAREKLLSLASYFAAEPPTPLEGISVTSLGQTYGPNDLSS